MTGLTGQAQPLADRLIGLLMLVVFRGAFTCLAAGLALWLWGPGTRGASHILEAGLIALLALPLLKILAVIAAAWREKDRLTLFATLTVLAVLMALTLRHAASLG